MNEVITMEDDLTINNVEAYKKSLLESFENLDSIKIDISSVNNIDVSGLQLLISISKEVKKQNKTVSCLGTFTESFMENLNKISFSPNYITNGEELQVFIKETM